LIVCGISVGFVLGTALGDAYSGTATGLLRGHDAVPSLLITVAASVAISFFFYSRGRAAYLQAHMAQAQRDATEARLKLLEAQLEPHMMFNTLANLRVLIATDPPRAQAMLDHLIAYLRATLGASRSTLHPLTDEFARLADYLEIMAVRMGPRLAFTLDLPESLHNAAVPPLLLQPLVENAVRHGLEPQVGGGHIRVRASTLPSASGTSLVLEVVDTGVGLAPPPTDHADGTASHFGLAQVRERLATLYGPQGTLELIAARAGGTSARVTFPLNFPTT
jgi:sensor histidine kinase YesM